MRFGILAVVLMCAVIKVIGIAAFAVSAFVQNHPNWFAIKQSVGGPVSVLNTTKAPVSISRRSAAAHPFPADGWVANTDFATEILPRAGGPYDVVHHLAVAGGHAPGAATRWGTTIIQSLHDHSRPRDCPPLPADGDGAAIQPRPTKPRQP